MKLTKTIEVNAFYGCDDVRYVECKSIVPPSLQDGSFSSDVYARAKLVVPEVSLDLYREKSSDHYWWRFYDITGAESVGVESVEEIDDDSLTVYNLNGVTIYEGSQSELNHICLPKGVYIVKSKKGILKQTF